MNRKEIIKEIKQYIDEHNNSVSINFKSTDTLKKPTEVTEVYRGRINNTFTDFYFVNTTSSIICLDVASDEIINTLHKLI